MILSTVIWETTEGHELCKIRARGARQLLCCAALCQLITAVWKMDQSSSSDFKAMLIFFFFGQTRGSQMKDFYRPIVLQEVHFPTSILS